MFRGAAYCLSRIIQWNGGMAEWRKDGMSENIQKRGMPFNMNLKSQKMELQWNKIIYN